MNEGGWIETASGNRIHKSCMIKGSKYVVIGGSTTIDSNCTVIVSGKEPVKPAKLIIGKCTYFKPSVELYLSRPTRSLYIGSFTMIGTGTKINNCSSIGSRVLIGERCEIDKNCTIYDCCILEDGTHLPSGYTVPPFTRVTRKLEYHNLEPSFRDEIEESVKTSLLFG
ncbi:DEKNAAC104445 [Brettanomyces naardenensis]|uniref:Dynactin subunit 5 n=1 Tax=Brettanomyces naardenensis TaxID=13370 RepID=A0A448YR20_BRENA|nr:DEKNAAC104445 [Brettanomyces naardenensis]